MMTPGTIFWAGADGDVDDARPLIDSFVAGGVDVGLLVSDGGANEYHAGAPLLTTRRGWLARNDAELRWRREGDRLLVTLVSEQPVPDVRTSEEQVGSISRGPTTTIPALERGSDPVCVGRVVYLGPDGTFIATRDEPRPTPQEG